MFNERDHFYSVGESCIVLGQKQMQIVGEGFQPLNRHQFALFKYMEMEEVHVRSWSRDFCAAAASRRESCGRDITHKLNLCPDHDNDLILFTPEASSACIIIPF